MLAAFAMIVGAAFPLFGPYNMLALTMVLPAIFALLIVAARTSRGGRRSRWGERD